MSNGSLFARLPYPSDVSIQARMENFPMNTNYMGKTLENNVWFLNLGRVAVISAKNHKRQRRKRQYVTTKREKSQTQKVLTAILTLPNLT